MNGLSSGDKKGIVLKRSMLSNFIPCLQYVDMKPAAIALLTLALTAASAHPAYEPDQLRDVDGEFMSFYTK